MKFHTVVKSRVSSKFDILGPGLYGSCRLGAHMGDHAAELLNQQGCNDQQGARNQPRDLQMSCIAVLNYFSDNYC